MKKRKFIIFALLFMLMNISAFSQSHQIKMNDVTVKQAMQYLKKNAGYDFVFEANDLQINKKVSINASSYQEAIKQMLDDQNEKYEINGNTVIISKEKKPESKQSTNVESHIINGSVNDIKGEPIIGATIRVKGTSQLSVSDIDGNFKINASNGDVLQVSYIGYSSKDIAIRKGGKVYVQLKEDQKSLEEVVVTAYGSQKRRDVTGSMEKVSFEKLNDIPVGQFTQKMQGQIAGVQVNQGTGIPGQGMAVKIRGAASLSTNSSPLYVVDGFPIVGDINNINPNEIESMTILKDAAATALYGSRAAFGVIMITTKGAKAGKTSVDVNAYLGIQSVPQKGRPDMMNGTEWAQFKKESYEDLGQTVPATYQNPSQYGEGTNWYDAMLRSALIQDYNVSIKSGTDKFSSSVVIGYFNQDGVLLNSDYNRISMRVNSMYKINNTLKLTFGVAPTYSFENRPTTDGAFFSGGGLLANANLTSPILNYKNADGSYPVTVTNSGITQVDTPNWVRSIKDITNKYTTTRILVNGALEYSPIKALLLKTALSADIGSTNQHYFQPSTAGRAFAAAPSKVNANLFEANNRYWSWLSETTGSYNVAFGENNIDLLGGFTIQKFRSDYSALSGSNYVDDRIQTIDLALVKNNPTMDVQEWGLVSFLGRLNYSYKDRYLLSASIRRDGSSRFGSNNKWGNFPAASVGWLVNEEKFMKRFDWLSLFKIRASYGTIGNNNIGNYTQYNVVSNANAIFGSSTESGIKVTNLGNIDLGWEKTNEFDFGVDLSFLNNRITFTYDYYNKITRNLLYALSVPRESGFSSFMGNVGKLKFWGHEFSVESHNLIGRFKWNTSFNISFSDNRVLALSGLSNQLIAYSGIVSTITKVGGKIGQFYGMVQDGVYKNAEDYKNSPKAVDSEVGTIKFKDVNGDKKITYDDVDGDKTEIGDPMPKFTYGMTNTFSYQNFDLSIVISGAYGNKIAMPMEQGMTNLDGIFNVLKDVEYRWRSEDNPGNGIYGKTTSATGRERDQFHSRYVCDGSYLTVKNITIGYTFPENCIKYVKGLRIYCSVQQPFVFTKYKYSNPEVGVDFSGNTPSALLQGIDYSTYPVPRTFTLGLNVNF